MSYLLVILYTAILFIRPQDWLFQTGVPLLDYVAGAAILTTLFKLAQGEWSVKKVPQHLLMLAFFLAIIASHVSHFRFSMTLDAIGEFGKTVLLYFLIVINIQTTKQLKGLVAVLVAAAVFMAIHGIFQHNTGVGFGGLPPMVEYRRGIEEMRVLGFGFFNDPNDLALILVSIMPFFLNPILRPGTIFPWRILNLVAAVAVSTCVYYTNSRGGWISMGLMLVAYFALHTRKKKFAIAAGTVAVLALLLVAPSRMGQVTASEGSARGRVMAWAHGNAMLKQNPLFGVGYSEFSDVSDEGLVAHNSYVHCYAELGLVGYFFWLALLASCLKDGWAIARVEPRDEDEAEMQRLARVMLVSLIAFLAASFFLSRTYIPALYVIVAMFAALRQIYVRTHETPPMAFKMKDMKWVLAAEIASIPALYVMIRILL